MELVKLDVRVPKEIFQTTRISKKELEEELKKNTAMELYKEGKLSFGKAAKLAGMCHNDFLNFLGQHKISIFNYTDEEIEEELLTK